MFRVLLATFALLTAFAQPVTAVVHGITHGREATPTPVMAVVTSTPSAGAGVAAAPEHATVGTLDEEPAEHTVLHTQIVATPAWSLMPALPAAAARPLVLTTIGRTTAAPRAPPAYPLSPHARLSDQPRAPPFG